MILGKGLYQDSRCSQDVNAKRNQKLHLEGFLGQETGYSEKRTTKQESEAGGSTT